MTDNLYSFSRQEAKSLGRLAQWKESHRDNIRCARDIENLIVSHTQDGQLEPDFVVASFVSLAPGYRRELAHCAAPPLPTGTASLGSRGGPYSTLDWWSFHRVQFVLSNTLHNADAQGFDADSLRWARAVYVPPDKTNGAFKIKSDTSLLAQFIRQAHAEYQKLGLFGVRHCAAGELDYTGKVLILRPAVLKEECWFPQNQLWYGECGFGCSPTARGQAVFATCLGDGEKTRWDRTDFVGVLDEQYLPDWAMERLAYGVPTANQRSVCGGERRSSVVSEPCRARQGEGYEACDDARGPAQEQTDGPAQGGMEMG